MMAVMKGAAIVVVAVTPAEMIEAVEVIVRGLWDTFVFKMFAWEVCLLG